jgi:hypothetical protein
MRMTIQPEPPEPEREAILAALARSEDAPTELWSDTALKEGVEDTEVEP